MKQYNLGPNGGILTASNLFATRFDQVVALLSARAAAGTLGTVLVDTPGQIEIFTWSASGQLISEALATHFRTVVVFVLDTPRCAAPQTFASNMLQAVSILYKLQLPMVLAFNKARVHACLVFLTALLIWCCSALQIDVVRPDAMLSWMDDFEVFHDALDAAPQSGYSSDLARSLSLVLDEFYRGLTTVGVSALTGEGCDDMVAALQKAGDAYDATYAVDLAARRAAITQEQTAKQAATLARFRGDHAADAAGAAEAAAAKGGSVAVHPGAMRRAEAEEEDSDDEEEGAARREGLDEYDDEDEE